MPNWDSIQYTIRGEENELQEIYDALLKMKESEHPDWAGSVLTGLGFDRKSLEDYQLRAFVQDFSLEDGKLVITTEEAWCMTHFPNLLLEKFPNLDLLYIQEEPGCQINETDDESSRSALRKRSRTTTRTKVLTWSSARLMLWPTMVRAKCAHTW